VGSIQQPHHKLREHPEVELEEVDIVMTDSQTRISKLVQEEAEAGNTDLVGHEDTAGPIPISPPESSSPWLPTRNRLAL